MVSEAASLGRTLLTRAGGSTSNTGKEVDVPREAGRRPRGQPECIETATGWLLPPHRSTWQRAQAQMRVSMGTTMKTQDKDGPHQHRNRTAKWRKEPGPRFGSLLTKLGKPTGSRVATPPPSHPQQSGLGMGPVCIVHPEEMVSECTSD